MYCHSESRGTKERMIEALRIPGNAVHGYGDALRKPNPGQHECHRPYQRLSGHIVSVKDQNQELFPGVWGNKTGGWHVIII